MWEQRRNRSESKPPPEILDENSALANFSYSAENSSLIDNEILALQAHLHQFISDRDWKSTRSVVDVLLKRRTSQTSPAIANCINSRSLHVNASIFDLLLANPTIPKDVIHNVCALSTPETFTIRTNPRNKEAVTLVEEKVEYAIKNSNFVVAAALLDCSGFPGPIRNSEGTILHLIAKHTKGSTVSRDYNNPFMLVERIIDEAPELVALRDSKNQLPILLFAESGEWSIVNKLAECHMRQFDNPLTLTECCIIQLKALCNQAPSAILSKFGYLLELADELHIPGSIPKEFNNCLKDFLFSKTRNVSSTDIQAVLGFIEKHSEYTDSSVLSEIVNAEVSASSLLEHFSLRHGLSKINEFDETINKNDCFSILSACYLSYFNDDLLESLINLGADTRYKFVVRNSSDTTSISVGDCTLFHLSLLYDDTEFASCLLSYDPEIIDCLNGQGQTALMMYAAMAEQTENSKFQYLLHFQSDINLTTPYGLNISDVLLLNGKFEFYSQALEHLPLPELLDKEKKYINLQNGHLESAGLKDIIDPTVKALANFNLQNNESGFEYLIPEIQKEAMRLFAHEQTYSMQDLHLYAMAARELTGKPIEGQALLRLMPRIMNYYTTGAIVDLMYATELYHDHIYYNVNEESYLPDPSVNAAEFLTILNSPDITAFDKKQIDFLIRVITSTERFVDQVPVVMPKKSTVENWARVGSYTHSFLRYKYDTRKCPESGTSLFEEFGFEPYEILNSKFGTAYVINGYRLSDKTREIPLSMNRIKSNSIDENTRVLCCHGGYLIHNPDLGCLFIKNSSPAFGRRLVKDTAYYADRESVLESELALSDIYSSLPEILTHENEIFQSIVSVQNSLAEVQEARTSKIFQLINQLDHVFAEYRNFKFNIEKESAFTLTDLNTYKLNENAAWKSTGFAKIVRDLKYWYQQSIVNPSIKEPALAFVHRYLPPWQKYNFRDQYDRAIDYLSLNQFRLEVLEASLNDSATMQDMLDCGLLQFFQMGTSNNAELIIIDKPRTKKD